MPTHPSNPQINLRPQDLLVLLRLALGDKPMASYAALATELGMTASALHASVGRCVQAQLARKDEDGKPVAMHEMLRLFLQHGARYAFPATRGGLTRGWPTAHAAEPLRSKIVQSNEPPPVWPAKDGPVRGTTFYPLYPSVPKAVKSNPALYEVLALFDAVRGGSPRERALALPMLEQRLA